MGIWIPIISLSTLGLLFGLGLAYASFLLAVKEDPRLKKIVDALPGTNCGACGFPGCHAVAERILKGETAIDTCPIGGASSAERIAAVLGVQLEKKLRRLAVVHCGADCSIRTKRADYDGVKTCLAAGLVAKGEFACTYSCLGYGDCVRICPVNAISIVNGLAKVDQKKCISCGLCAKECPRKIISLENYDKAKGVAIIACSSHDKGAIVRKICKVGCIACGICQKNSPDEVFKVEDNLAKIYYNKASAQTNWDVCIEKCPTNTIVKIG